MADIMMKLGAYSFSVTTAAYQDLRRVTEYRWQAQERINNLDALQFTGRNKDSIVLSGSIYPHYRGAGAGQINAMRAEADKGLPLLLVDGLGVVHGQWVILKIEEQQSVHFANGIPRKQQFNLELRKYADAYV